MGANTQITIASNIQRDQQWTSGQSRSYFTSFDNIESDNSGFADFTPNNQRNSRMFAAAKNGDNIAFFGEVYWSGHARANESRPMAYIYTDRPVYRPEQTVYWRAIVRDSNDGEYAIPQNRKFTVEIRDTRNEEVLKKSGLELSEFGTLDGELTLLAGAPLGRYNITIHEEGSQRPRGPRHRRLERPRPAFCPDPRARRRQWANSRSAGSGDSFYGRRRRPSIPFK